jgi:formate hydrogenlyase subunit 3/multisubunit Na+/H+ antiporter MnhD subunit
MKVVKALSVIGLAAYLIFQGLFYIAEAHSPAIHAIIGILGLVSGALIFISLSHWIHGDHRS